VTSVCFPIFCSTVVTGPVTHYLYQFLEGVVPKRSNFSAVKKAVLERILFAPPYLLALFYSVAIMEVGRLTSVLVVTLDKGYVPG
jgi:peroxisomal membrane protein 2